MDAPVVVSGPDHWFGQGEARKPDDPDGAIGVGQDHGSDADGGLREVQGGSVRLLGSELNGAAAPVQQALRRRLGFIFQAHNLHGNLTARQNVLMGLQVHGRGVANVCVGSAFGDTRRHPSAWICDFSSTHSTMRWFGGDM